MREVIGLQVDSDETVGEGGFLRLRRLRLRARYAGGELSEPFLYDYVERSAGLDAVAVAIYHRTAEGVRVLLRDGMRPALHFGRPAELAPVPDPREYLMLTELVAGIIEPEDRGEAGIKARAAEECLEEAGFPVDPADILFLGAPTYPTPGAMPEKFWLAAVEVDPSTEQKAHGDGSPMEHGARTRWVELDVALQQCTRGDIEDCKTELALRRLKDVLEA